MLQSHRGPLLQHLAWGTAVDNPKDSEKFFKLVPVAQSNIMAHVVIKQIRIQYRRDLKCSQFWRCPCKHKHNTCSEHMPGRRKGPPWMVRAEPKQLQTWQSLVWSQSSSTLINQQSKLNFPYPKTSREWWSTTATLAGSPKNSSSLQASSNVLAAAWAPAKSAWKWGAPAWAQDGVWGTTFGPPFQP